MDRKNRLKEVYKHLQSVGKIHTQKGFADALGKAEGTISKAFNGDEKALTDNLFVQITLAFPDTFSLDYLLTGEGSLLLNAEANEKPEPNVSINDKLIGMLKSQLDLLREQLQAKDRHIEKLLDELRELRHANNQYKIHEHDNDILNFTSEDP